MPILYSMILLLLRLSEIAPDLPWWLVATPIVAPFLVVAFIGFWIIMLMIVAAIKGR